MCKDKRQKLSIVQLLQKFPTDDAAEEWFIAQRWGDKITCPVCNSDRMSQRKTVLKSWRCKDCRKDFTTRTGTLMQASNLGFQKWLLAIYLVCTSLKGIASTKLASDLGISQKAAWHLAMRIRETYANNQEPLDGVIEADETFIGGKAVNMSRSKRVKMKDQAYEKAIVIGLKERDSNRVIAQTIPTTGARAIQPVVRANVQKYSIIVSDENPSYKGLAKDYHHWAVNHSSWEYVRGMAHTNGIESFWSMLKRGYMGVYHYMSEKHLDRYVREFAGRHNARQQDTICQMASMAFALRGKRLRYADLICKNI